MENKMPKFIALQSFMDDRLGDVKRGAEITLNDLVAQSYKKNNLIEDVVHP